MAGLTVFIDDELARYGFGDNHPFGVDRQGAFVEEFVRRGLDKQVDIRGAAKATDEQLLYFHTADYLDRVKKQTLTGHGYLDCGDTPAFKGVYEVAATVVGTTLAAVDAVASQAIKQAFIPIAGLHHGRRDSAAGFCVFNDCGVAIEALRRIHGIKRVAYVDIDAHHGDGVFYAFESDPDVIVVDFHEDGNYLYPGTGFVEETGKGGARDTKRNVTLPPNANDGLFMKHWDDAEVFIEQAAPEFILFQCGADGIGGDPITHLSYSPAVHAHAATRLSQIAHRVCDGKLVVMGGGGYNRKNLANAWCAAINALLKVNNGLP